MASKSESMTSSTTADSMQSRSEFSQRATRINHYVREWKAVGFRSGFMLNQLDWLHELDIQYDASTFDIDPFEPQPQGRHTIFPFWISNRARGLGGNGSFVSESNHVDSRPGVASTGYVELPYTLPQDSTLFILLQEKTPAIWFRKLDWLARHGGMALVITHPDYMAFGDSSPNRSEYPVQLYRQFLQYIQDRYSNDYWLALPKEVAAYSRQAIFQADRSVAGNPGGPAEKEVFRVDNKWRLRGKRAAALLFSYYPADPRPRRAAEALATEGVTVDVVSLQRDRSEPRREVINGVNVFRVPLKRRRGRRMSYIGQYAIFILRSFLFLTRRSLIRRYDIVHVHNMPDFLVFSALVPKALGARIVLDVHDPVPELMQTIFEVPEESFSVRLLKRLEKWSIRFADLVLTVNLACKKIYISRSCPSDKIDVVLNSPEDDVFQFQPPAAHPSNGQIGRPFVILYHGSLVRRNGFDLAVDAVELAKKSIPATSLAVCGERSSFFEEVMESARERDLGESIKYLGMKSRQGIVEAINACDLGIIPNHRNIFTEINTPTRIFEYLALGKPVIAPQTRGIRDYFGEEDLIFFELGNATDLARKIEFAFANPDLVREIVKRGQQVYLSHRWAREKSIFLNLAGDLV